MADDVGMDDETGPYRDRSIESVLVLVAGVLLAFLSCC
jgi:hypothetical protein